MAKSTLTERQAEWFLTLHLVSTVSIKSKYISIPGAATVEVTIGLETVVGTTDPRVVLQTIVISKLLHITLGKMFKEKKWWQMSHDLWSSSYIWTLKFNGKQKEKKWWQKLRWPNQVNYELTFVVLIMEILLSAR